MKPFRWWQLPFRALLHLRLPGDDGRETVYAVDVRHWQNQSSGNVKAHLYLDGRLHAVSKLPAVFPVPGGTVEVRMSGFGLKRCHYVADEGRELQLVPDPDSAEGLRPFVAKGRSAGFSRTRGGARLRSSGRGTADEARERWRTWRTSACTW
ncbi:hypothetical protein [Streptomyces sp. NPDC058583]|uniref:hypothetical protein n=1 Tax=unclassified Streptomyces TaxID=2593676 RepID=UPI003648CB3C